MQTQQTSNKIILLNYMYSGRYIKEGNLGHEVINMYQSDNGNNYIYLQSDGKLPEQYTKYIKDMSILLIRFRENKVYEIIGKATELELVPFDVINKKGEPKKYSQETYITDNKVTYQGAAVNEIFASNNKYQDICLTFKAKKVIKPKEPIYIQFKGKPTDDNIITDIDGDNNIKSVYLNPSGEPLRQYIKESEDKANFDTLNKVIETDSIWENSNVGKVPINNASYKFSMFDICRIEYNELAYSSALYYFLKKYPDFANMFVKNVLGIDSGIIGGYQVDREKNHIDLLLTDDEKIIIIENKIKSQINGVTVKRGKTTTQLDKYVKTVKDDEKKRIAAKRKAKESYIKKEIYVYVLAPNYNNLEIKFPTDSCITSSQKIFYSNLYELMIKQAEYKNDVYFKAFTDSIKRHTHDYDDILYHIMESLFIERIDELKSKRLKPSNISSTKP